MRFHLEQELLRDGNYDVITSGMMFYDGSDMSRLIPDTNENVLADVGLQAGQVWQSAFKNWVYEDVPALNPSVVLRNWPIAFRASGVYIDGAFRATNDSVYPHTIDFLNGRIIFNNPLPLDKIVQADFTRKKVTIMGLREFNNQLKSAVLQQQYSDNPRTANQLIYPSGNTGYAPLPLIFIENVGRRYAGGYQLGDRSLIAKDELTFEIWALDESTRDNLIDLISFQERKNIPILNFNIVPMPLSGILNTISPEFIPYENLALNQPLPGPQFSGLNPVAFRGFLEDTEIIDLDSMFNDSVTQSPVFERATVRMSITTHPIMPTTPFGLDVVLEGMTGSEVNP